MNLRKLLANFLSLSSINIIGMLIPILTMPILSRSLGSELFGKVLLYNTILQFGFIVVDYSFNYTGSREIAAKLDDKVAKLKVYFDVQACRAMLLFLYTLLVPLIFTILNGFDYIHILAFVGLGLVGHWLLSVWYFQGESNLKIVALATITARLCYLLTLVSFVREQDDFDIVIFSNVVPLFLAGLFVCIKSGNLKYYTRHNVRCALGNISTNIKSGANVFVGDFAPNLYNNVPMMIIGVTSSGTLFAAYAVATRICNACVSIQGMMAKALYPLIVSSKVPRLKFALLCNVFLSVSVGTTIYIFAEDIVYILLGPGYDMSIDFIRVAIFGVFFVAIANSFGQGYFLPNKLDRVFRNVSLFVSIVSAIIGIFLLNFYDVWGAVYLLLFARVLFSITYYITYLYFKDRQHS